MRGHGGCMMSYWLCQHLGNPPKLQREDDEGLPTLDLVFDRPV